MNIQSIIPSTSLVRIEIINLLGQTMLEKDFGIREAGKTKFEVDMSTLPDGIYIVRLHSASRNNTGLLLKR